MNVPVLEHMSVCVRERGTEREREGGREREEGGRETDRENKKKNDACKPEALLITV